MTRASTASIRKSGAPTLQHVYTSVSLFSIVPCPAGCLRPRGRSWVGTPTGSQDPAVKVRYSTPNPARGGRVQSAT
eukprot:8522699-Alexandrium_andersonii.AAC.1